MPPAAVNLTGAVRSVQLFKISGFAATKVKPGYTASRVLAVGGLDWRIEFHPKASNPSTYCSGNEWIMFRVRLISKGSGGGVAASFGCRLVDPSPPLGDSEEETVKSSVFHENKALDVFLIKWSDLEGSRYRKPKDDCIFVQCAPTLLEVEAKEAAAASNAAASFPSSDLHQQLGDLLRSQKGADITFLVAGESIVAHRSVLAARSPVFMAGLFGDMKEKSSTTPVEINDMEVEVFRAMLRFVYTDTVPELEQKGDEQQATLMAQHLLEAADRYGLERLKRICVEKVSTDIRVDTVATALVLAELHGCSELKSSCIKFILATPENLHAVAATEAYKDLEASCPSVLTELLKLIANGNK